jgi:hypothetical protein
MVCALGRVYVPDATMLFVYPAAIATALILVVWLTLIPAEVYLLELLVGFVFPSVV